VDKPGPVEHICPTQAGIRRVSRPVGGILSPGPFPGTGWVVIHLSGLPGDIGRAGRPTFDLAPGGVYQAARVTPAAGALLPHRFNLACGRRPSPLPIGGLFSVALSCGSPRLAVSQHLALRSPDLPRPSHCPARRRSAWPRPPGQLTQLEFTARLPHPRARLQAASNG